MVPTSTRSRSYLNQQGLRWNLHQHMELRKGSPITDPHWLHRLSRGGSHNLGYYALRWDTILHGNAGELGKYAMLKTLPDKIARFLYEYHDSSYGSLDLPPLEVDRSRIDVHGILEPHEVKSCIQYVTYCIICKIWVKIRNMLFWAYFAYLTYLMYRTEHCWTHCVCKTPTPPRVTFVFIPLSWLVIKSTLARCVFHRGHLCPRNCSRPIARTWCSSGRQESLRELFSSEWITSGSVNCFFFAKSKLRPTQEL